MRYPRTCVQLPVLSLPLCIHVLSPAFKTADLTIHKCTMQLCKPITLACKQQHRLLPIYSFTKNPMLLYVCSEALPHPRTQFRSPTKPFTCYGLVFSFFLGIVHTFHMRRPRHLHLFPIMVMHSTSPFQKNRDWIVAHSHASFERLHL